MCSAAVGCGFGDVALVVDDPDFLSVAVGEQDRRGDEQVGGPVQLVAYLGQLDADHTESFRDQRCGWQQVVCLERVGEGVWLRVDVGGVAGGVVDEGPPVRVVVPGQQQQVLGGVRAGRAGRACRGDDSGLRYLTAVEVHAGHAGLEGRTGQ